MVDKFTAPGYNDPWQRTYEALVADIAAHLDLDGGLAEITGTIKSSSPWPAPQHGQGPDPRPDRHAALAGDDVGTGDVISNLRELQAVLQRFGGDPNDADLTAVNMQGAELPGADLHGADLSRADMRDANLARANLQGAVLRGANLQGADFDGADLEHAELEAAVWDVSTKLPHALASRMRQSSREVAPGVFQVPPESSEGPALVTRR